MRPEFTTTVLVGALLCHLKTIGEPQRAQCDAHKLCYVPQPWVSLTNQFAKAGIPRLGCSLTQTHLKLHDCYCLLENNGSRQRTSVRGGYIRTHASVRRAPVVPDFHTKYQGDLAQCCLRPCDCACVSLLASLKAQELASLWRLRPVVSGVKTAGHP